MYDTCQIVLENDIIKEKRVENILIKCIKCKSFLLSLNAEKSKVVVRCRLFYFSSLLLYMKWVKNFMITTRQQSVYSSKE